MLSRRALAFILLTALSIAQAVAARAEEARTALVIGNSGYAFSPLANPGRDAAEGHCRSCENNALLRKCDQDVSVPVYNGVLKV
jgi:hypothetical protein